jgi:hypothetical protein
MKGNGKKCPGPNVWNVWGQVIYLPFSSFLCFVPGTDHGSPSKNPSMRNNLPGTILLNAPSKFGELFVYCSIFIVCGRGDPAPTLTFRIHKTFGTIRNLATFVKVGARFPRPHIALYFLRRGVVSENGDRQEGH